MKLIKPSYEIITPIAGEEILKQIELAARTCYKSVGTSFNCEPHGGLPLHYKLNIIDNENRL